MGKGTPPEPNGSNHRAADYGLPERVECPFCHREDGTELHSPFGPQLSVATYWCRHCHTPFDYLKWR